jgi:hypothetical protein
MNVRTFVQIGSFDLKALFTILAFLVETGAHAQVTNCASAPSGLVSWWRAELDCSDAVGSNNGTPHTGVSFTNGEVGQAFSFDGTSNAFIEVPDAPELRLTSEVTIEFWVKRQRLTFPGLPYADYVVEKGGDWTGGQDNYSAALHNPQYNYCLAFIFAGGWRGGGSIADTNTWHHCAITARYGDTDPTLYIDGVAQPVVYSEGASTINLYNSTRPLHIGAQLDANTGWFYYSQVLLDELSVYNRVLSAAEIQALYNAGSAGKCLPPPAPPTITSQPASVQANAGTTVTFDVSVNGTSPLYYQWYFDSNALAGGTGHFLSLTNVSSSQTGTYFVVVTNAYGAVTSTNATLIVLNSSPTIIQQPQNTNVFVGANLAFTVLAGGLPTLAYQWQKDGTSLRGATGSIYRILNAQVTNSGAYSVVITNPYGSVTSSNATLTVLNSSPTIIQQPQNTNVSVGANVAFPVVAAGWPPFRYQWQKDGAPLPGAISSIYRILNAQVTNSGAYSVVVTNPYGSVTSSNATLVVQVTPPCVPPPPGLVSWWRAENNELDSWGSNDAVEGRPLYGYGPGKVGQAFGIPGPIVLDSLSLRLTNALTLQAWIYPTNLSGTGPYTIISKVGLYTVNQSSFWLGTTNNGLLCFLISGSGASFPGTNTTLLGPALPTNQWSFVVATYDGNALRLYVNGALAALRNYSGGIFPGNQNLGIGVVPITKTGYEINYPFSGSIDEVCIYNRALADSEIQDIYNADVLGMCLQPPVIVSQPQSQAIPLGEDVLFSVGVQGNRPLLYQWFFNSNALPGATNSWLVLERIQTNQAGAYAVSITNSVGFARSPIANLTLLPAPTCTHAPDGMISWWPANNSAVDVVGTNNATASYPYNYVPGKIGGAFTTYYTNSYGSIQVPNFNFASNADFSIEAWVKALPFVPLRPGMLPNQGMVIFQKRPSGPNSLLGPGFALTLYDGRLAFWLASSRVITVFGVISGGPDLRDGMFHHLAVTVQRSVTNGSRLYVDGQSVLTFDTTSPSQRGSLGNEYPALIASALQGQVDGPLAGYVDELAIYNRALTADEIMAIRTAGAAGKCDNPPLVSSFLTKGLQDEPLTIPTYRFLLFGYDPDGDPLSLFSVASPSHNGRPVVLGTNQVTYTPAPGYLGQDSFAYTISDGHGGRTPATALVLIEPRMFAAATVIVPSPPGPAGLQLSFSGYPERTYTVQRAESFQGPWIDLGTAMTDADGLADFTDPSPPPVGAYYRAAYRSPALPLGESPQGTAY